MRSAGRPGKLTLLAAITAFVLLSIMGLQLYWLFTSYKEQRSRFSADIENALSATLIKKQLEVTMPSFPSEYSNPLMQEQIKDIVSSVVSKMPRSALKKGKADDTMAYVTINEPIVAIAPGYISPDGRQAYIDSIVKLRDSTRVIDMSTLRNLATAELDLNELKDLLAAELGKRSINTPFEVAMLDSSGTIKKATCDTALFKDISLRSQPNDLLQNNAMPHMSVQIAFPDANMYLLRRMSWIISVSALLIVIACISFSYLLVRFFRQKRLADIRNDFMNNMTHELKTPISSVSIALEMLEDRSRPLVEDVRQEYVTIAHNELRRLTMLVDKVLKIAAFEKGEIVITRERFATSPWLLQCVNSMRPLLNASAADITTKLKPSEMELWADRTHLTNLLQNLVENALKYNDKQQPKIDISIYDEGTMCVLQIADNGKGIPAAYVNKVFDKFFRVPSGDLHETKGYGLGLSYVKGITELHGGSIKLESTEGKGSIFTIRLPKEH